LPRVTPNAAADRHEVVGARRAVFLDRDGVLNRSIVRGGKPYAPQSVEAIEVLPGVEQALQQLRQAGFLNVVVTNQPDVGTGKLARAVADAMNARLAAMLPIDAVKVCYHRDEENCRCRKPKPGLIVDAAQDLGIDVSKSFMVGDRWRDVGAAQAAGCPALFIDYGYSETRPEQPYVPVKSLADAAGFILKS
jgi:D-glycero-D-manno-heptose 1,7-bisphosphate phosphatase